MEKKWFPKGREAELQNRTELRSLSISIFFSSHRLERAEKYKEGGCLGFGWRNDKDLIFGINIGFD